MEIFDAYLIRSGSAEEHETLLRIEKVIKDSTMFMSFQGMGPGFGNFILVGRHNIKKIKELLREDVAYSLSLIEEMDKGAVEREEKAN